LWWPCNYPSSKSKIVRSSANVQPIFSVWQDHVAPNTSRLNNKPVTYLQILFCFCDVVQWILSGPLTGSRHLLQGRVKYWSSSEVIEINCNSSLTFFSSDTIYLRHSCHSALHKQPNDQKIKKMSAIYIAWRNRIQGNARKGNVARYMLHLFQKHSLQIAYPLLLILKRHIVSSKFNQTSAVYRRSGKNVRWRQFRFVRPTL
jgi:hypothetical protein